MSEESSSLTFRVAGLGHNLTIQIDGSATVSELKREVGRQTGIPPAYQNLLTRGIKLFDDKNTLSLTDAGLKDRTKIMLLHNALFAKERDCFESLSALEKEIDELEAKQQETEPHVLSELVTRICCKLDGVDTKGSENLRLFRKDLIRKAESIEKEQLAR